MDVTEIEKRIDRAVAAPISINAEVGGVMLETMGQMMEFAKLMSVSGSAVPGFLRGNPGGCLAICSRASRWGMDPFAVAEKAYQVVNKGEERIAYEAQLVHAVVTMRAPLKNRLRYTIEGEGDERRCVVWGTFKGETEPHRYLSPTLKEMLAARPKRRDGSGYGGSPLWETLPEVQLAYSTVRQWARLNASEVLLGVYTPDELEDGSTLKDVTPKLSALEQRLRDAKLAHVQDRGFDADHIERSVSSTISGDVNSEVTEQEDVKDERSGDEPHREGGQDQPDGDGISDRDQGAGGGDVGTAAAAGGEPAGQEVKGAKQTGEADVFPPDRKPKPKAKR